MGWPMGWTGDGRFGWDLGGISGWLIHACKMRGYVGLGGMSCGRIVNAWDVYRGVLTVWATRIDDGQYIPYRCTENVRCEYQKHNSNIMQQRNHTSLILYS